MSFRVLLQRISWLVWASLLVSFSGCGKAPRPVVEPVAPNPQSQTPTGTTSTVQSTVTTNNVLTADFSFSVSATSQMAPLHLVAADSGTNKVIQITNASGSSVQITRAVGLPQKALNLDYAGGSFPGTGGSCALQTTLSAGSSCQMVMAVGQVGNTVGQGWFTLTFDNGSNFNIQLNVNQ